MSVRSVALNSSSAPAARSVSAAGTSTAALTSWQARVSKIPPRFRRHIRFDDSGCWIWTGPLPRPTPERPHAYPRQTISGGPDGAKTVAVHRLLWELTGGPLREGYQLDHTCERVLCVNPGHLQEVLPEENQRRSQFRLSRTVVTSIELRIPYPNLERSGPSPRCTKGHLRAKNRSGVIFCPTCCRMNAAKAAARRADREVPEMDERGFVIGRPQVRRRRHLF